MSEDDNKIIYVNCCVKNCQKKIPDNQVLKINDNYFCKICGVAYYRSFFNF